LNFFNGVPSFSTYFTSATTGYILCGDSIAKTIDGGTTWAFPYIGPSISGYSIFFPNVDTGYVSCAAGKILKTINGGTSWTLQITPTNQDLRSLYFINSNTGYAVGYGGTIVKTTTGGGTGVNEHQDISRLLRIHPNPSSDNITIEASENLHCSLLTIMNINCQEVLNATIHNPKSTIDIKNLPSGVYFVKVTGEKGVQVGKIIKE
jgi:hypothetical protein